MRALCYLLLILLGLLHPTGVDHTSTVHHVSEFNFEHVGNGQDRCCNTGCVARVTPNKGELVAKIKEKSEVVEIFFDEGSSTLNESDIVKIQDFLKKNGTKADIELIGYADGCGTWSYNKRLSAHRVEAVKKKIMRLNTGVDIKTHAAGELSHGHDPRNRKVHLTLSSNVTLYEPPPKIVGDVYLIDSSGSMAGTKFELYRRSINYHRPPGSLVYIATTACVSSMSSFNSLSPTGGTEIWYSYWYILDKMRPGQTLVIISDFDTTYPLQPWERTAIQKKAQAKKIKVKAISI